MAMCNSAALIGKIMSCPVLDLGNGQYKRISHA